MSTRLCQRIRSVFYLQINASVFYLQIETCTPPYSTNPFQYKLHQVRQLIIDVPVLKTHIIFDTDKKVKSTMVATSSSSGGAVSSNAGNPLANGGFFQATQLHLKKRGYYNENVFKKAKEAKIRQETKDLVAEFEFEQGIRMQNVKRRGPGEDGENVYQRMVKAGVDGGLGVSGPPESLK